MEEASERADVCGGEGDEVSTACDGDVILVL